MKISLVRTARFKSITQPSFADYEPPTPLPHRPRSQARDGGAYASRACGDSVNGHLLTDLSSRESLAGLARQGLDNEMFESRKFKGLAINPQPPVLDRELVEATERGCSAPNSRVQTAGEFAHLHRSGETSVRAGSQRSRPKAGLPGQRDLNLKRVRPGRRGLDRPLGGWLGQFRDNRLWIDAVGAQKRCFRRLDFQDVSQFAEGPGQAPVRRFVDDIEDSDFRLSGTWR